MRPYFLASSALIKKSLSESTVIFSVVWPVWRAKIVIKSLFSLSISRA